jgi:hypothetical protein
MNVLLYPMKCQTLCESRYDNVDRQSCRPLPLPLTIPQAEIANTSVFDFLTGQEPKGCKLIYNT